MMKKYQKHHISGVKRDDETFSMWLARNLISKRLHPIVTARVHIIKGANAAYDFDQERKKIISWYEKSTKRLNLSDTPDDAKCVYIKKIYVSFTRCVVAFSVYVGGDQVYLTMTKYNNNSLQSIKKIFNEAEKNKLNNMGSCITTLDNNSKISIPIETYIHYDK